MIKEQSNKFPVMLMCRLLTVSVSGYYSWLHREPCLREKENIKLAFKIKAIFDDEKSRPGSPRITESWNHSFKVEAIHGEKLTTRALTKSHVFEYIEIYYNRKRLHSTIRYKTPESFEVKMVA